MVSLKLAIRRYHNELHGMRQKDPSIDKVRSAESADARKEKKALTLWVRAHICPVPVHTD